MSYFSQYKGLPRQVYILGILRLTVGIGSMVFSFSSLLFTSVLGLSDQVSSFAVMGIAVFTALGNLFGGKMADRIGRKKTYLLFSAAALMFFIIGTMVCRTVWIIPCLYMSFLFCNGCGPALNGLVADCVDSDNSVECFSFLYLCVNLGFAIGPSIGGLLFTNHLELIFALQGIVYFAAALVLYFTIEEKYVPIKTSKATGKIGIASEKGTLALLFERNLLLIFIIGLAMTTLCYQMINFVLPLQMKDLFGLEASARYAGNVWTVNGLTIVFVTPFLINKFIKKNHHIFNSMIAAVLYGLGFSIYIWAKSVPFYFIAVIIWTMGEIMMTTGSGAFIAMQSPPSHRARFQAIAEIGRCTGRAVSPPICALIMKSAGTSGTWEVNVTVCLLMAIMFRSCYKHYVKPGEKK